MSKKVLYWIGGLAALGVVGIAGSYAIGSSPIMIGASFMNLFRIEGNPPGSIDVEVRKSASETDQLAAAIFKRIDRLKRKQKAQQGGNQP